MSNQEVPGFPSFSGADARPPGQPHDSLSVNQHEQGNQSVPTRHQRQPQSVVSLPRIITAADASSVDAETPAAFTMTETYGRKRRRPTPPMFLVMITPPSLRHHLERRSSSASSDEIEVSLYSVDGAKEDCNNLNRGDHHSPKHYHRSYHSHPDNGDNHCHRHRHHHHHHDQPDLALLFLQLSAMLLTTVLAVVSALDAKQHCLQQETYALLDLVDDDNFQKTYESTNWKQSNLKCVAIFRNVLIPTGAVTVVLGFFALALVYRHNKYYGANMNIPATVSLRLCGQVLVLLFAIVSIQCYNVLAIMLLPRSDNDGGEQQREYNNEDEERHENPYQSLAAVDRYGEVGDNANLYYLAWVSFALALTLVYQVSTSTWRLYIFVRRSHTTKNTFLSPDNSRIDTNYSHFFSINNHDYSKSWFYESRAMWYNSLYRLRIRTGIWVAALISCLIIVASSQYIWSQKAQSLIYEDSNAYAQVCNLSEDSDIGPQFCQRTIIAWLSGVVAAGMCATAIILHWAGRSKASILQHEMATPNTDNGNLVKTSALEEEIICGGYASTTVLLQNRLPLRTELFLSIVLSLLLGFNALFCTGVRGPAPTVGNLYYASWLSFLLCLRICLGCVEESYNIEDNQEHHEKSMKNTVKKISNQKQREYEAPSLDLPLKTSLKETSRCVQQDSIHHEAVAARYTSPRDRDETFDTMTSQSGDTDGTEHSTFTDPLESERVRRLRGYFFLGVFSTVCAAAAYDAASNEKESLDRIQLYMILAPCVVALQSALLFLLCLSKPCYAIVSHLCFGGILSIFSFCVCLVNLVLTMHSDESWAVDAIGEIKMANLYYFTWASILSAGLQMMNYVKAYLGCTKTDYMSVVWVGICKVCFVSLGAALHIWHTISANCDFDEITMGAVTFCSRTVLAIVISITGMVVGSIIVLLRLAITFSAISQKWNRRLQAHVEMLTSIFLVLLFGAAVAMITGIGGPGQSVGDLYYSTWLAFCVSIGIFVRCYEQIQAEESQQHGQQQLYEGGQTSGVLV